MRRKVGALLSYVMMGVEIVSTLFLTPFIIRNLGQAEYGIYKLSAAIVSYLFLLDLGVGNAVVRYIAKFRVENNIIQSRKFLGISTLYYLVVAVLCLFLGVFLIAIYPYAFAKGLSSDEIILGRKLLGIAVLTSAVSLGTTGFSNTIVAYERFEISKGLGIVQVLLRIAIIILLLRLGFRSIGIVLANLFLTIFIKLFNVAYVLGSLKIRPCFKDLDKSFIKEIIVYSSFILLQMVATQINMFADEIMLGAFVVASSYLIGIYGVGHQITEYFQSLGNAITGVLMPGVVRMVEGKCSNDEIQSEMTRIGRIIFMILSFVWIGFLLLGRDFISLWAGHDYVDAYYVTLLISFVYVFILSENVGSQILWAKNQHKEQSIMKIIVVIVNVFATYYLIKWKPLIGATIGTAMALIIGDIIIMNIIFTKKFGFRIGRYYLDIFKGIIPSLTVSLICGYAFRLIAIKGWIGLFLTVLVMTTSYIICMVGFGLNDTERNMIIGMFKKISSFRMKQK